MKQRTIRWVVEQMLTYKELCSPPDTPSEWWPVPTMPAVIKGVDHAMSIADNWKSIYPDRQIRIVEVEEIRTPYLRKDDGTYTQK